MFAFCLCCVGATAVSNERARWTKWRGKVDTALAACTAADQSPTTTLTPRMQEELDRVRANLAEDPHTAEFNSSNRLEATVWKVVDGEAGTARTTFISCLDQRTLPTGGLLAGLSYYRPSCTCGRPQVRPPTD